MIRTGFDSRVKIYDIIESQLPSFILDENPKAAEFLKQYYISQEYQGGPVDIAENLDQYLKFNIIQSDAVSNREIYLTSDVDTENKITINVNSTKGFPEKYGLLKIDNEIITYTGITSTSFLNCQRGFSGITDYHDDLNEEELVFETTNVESHSALAPVTNLSSLFVKEFFKKLKYTFAPGFEELEFDENLNIGNFIKSLRSFYQSKGTEESFEILFKILYGVDATVVNLENFLLKPSSAEYVRREVVLIENISGEPNNLVGQSIQKENDPTTNASVSEVEVVTRNFKRYYKLSLFVGYDDFSTVQGNFIVTPKSKCTENVPVGSSIISVDSTIGFETSGTLISGDNTITYTSKSVNQFFGCSGVDVEIPLSQEIRSNDTYFGYENGDRSKKVTFTILGSLSNFNQISDVLNGVSEGDSINIKSVGDPIGRTKNYRNSFKEIFVNSWVYNANSRWKINNFNGPKSLNLSSAIIRNDETSFKHGDEVEIVERGTNNVVFSTYISEEIGENSTSIKILGSFVPVSGVQYDLRRKLNKASSLNTPLKFGNDNIISDITNLYTNKTHAYVASNSVPSSNRGLSNIPYNYQITKKLDSFYIDDITGTLSGKEDINFSIIGFENPVTFLTGDRIYYQPDSEPLVGLEEGYYFVEIVSADLKKIKLYSSTSFIGTNNYQLFRSPYLSGIGKHTFTLAIQKSAVIGPQKLLRKFPLDMDPNLTDSSSKEILPGQIGLLINGVEIDSYKSPDKIYYGPLESVNILNNGSDYDVINLPSISIVDGTGNPAKIQPVISGSIEKVYVEPQNFDIDKIVSIGVNGGNGRGAILEPILNLRVREVLFDGRATTSGGGINTVTGQLTFDTNHNFPDGEEIFYSTNGNLGIGVGIGTSTLTDGASYYPKSTSPRTVYLYPSFKDYSVGINTIKFNTDNNFGVHKFFTKSNKKTLTEIKILNGGEGYTNRKLIVKPIGISTDTSTINFPNHGFNNGDLLVYEYETSPIAGIPTDTDNQFYVLKVNNDSFRICDAGINGTISSNYERKNYIKFKNQGSGYQYFKYPDIKVYVEFTSVGISSDIQPPKILTVTPSVKGKIIDAYLYEKGSEYGSTILNFEKKPKIIIKNGKEAKVTPNIDQGRINTVKIEYGGLEYFSIPEVIAVDPTGKGSGAEFLPIIQNGRIKEIKVLSSGLGYSSTSTIKVISSGKNALFDVRVRDLTLNNVSRFGNTNFTETLNDDLKYSILAYSETLQNSFGDDGQNHSKIIGWAYDGNPIYGAYGYSDPEDVNSVPKSLVSGYVLDTSYEDRPSYPNGFFINDYKFVGAGDLDENNGRFGKTPEFPLGIYAYFSPINSVSKLPQFPYFVGDSFKSNIIEENFYLSEDSFDFAGEKVLRNTYPYKLIDPNVESDFLSSFYDLKNQVVKVRSTSSGTIDGYNLLSKGDNYKVNDILSFKSDSDESLSARVSSLEGNVINNIVCDQQYYNDVILTKVDSQKLKLTILPSHDISNNEYLSLVGFSTIISGLDGIYKVGISTVSTTLSKDIAPASSIGSTEIYVSNIPADIVPGSLIGIGTETATVLNTYKIKNIIAIGRTVTGVGHTAKTQIELIPNSFTINKPITVDVDSKLNNKVYFNPKQSIGVGTLSGESISTSFGFADFVVSRDIPTRSIYLENHTFVTNQKVLFTPPAGTISVSTDGTTSFSIPLNGQSEELYVVNKSINSIGLKTSFDSPELFFHTNGVDDDNYLLETKFNQIKGSLTRFRTTVSTAGTHGLSSGDSVRLSVKPSLNVGIGTSTQVVVSYNETYKKLLFDTVGFGSTAVTVSQFYYNKPTQQNTIDTYVGFGLTVGLGTTGNRTSQEIYNYIWHNYDNLDLDGDGVVSDIDALIAQREMIGVGFTGDSLIQGIVIPGNATRRTADQIRTHIDSVTNGVGIGSTLFDINDSGRVDSNIDGELLIRFSTTVGLGKPGTFNPSKIRGSINLENHKFSTGDKVLYLSNENTPLLPVDDGEYYIIAVDPNNIQLALTYTDCVGDSPNAVSIGFTGSEGQSISLINPQITVIRNNILNFNLQDESLSGYDFEIYYDENFNHKFTSTKESGTFSISKVGTPGISSTAELLVDCDDETPQNLYYSITKDGNPVKPDYDTINHSKIVYENSLYIKDDRYTISGIGSTSFKVFLERIPERLSYSKEECDELKYTTTSKSAFGPIDQIEITSGKALYRNVPVLDNIQTENGRDANITLRSDTVGDIKEVQITTEGFSYQSDPTLNPTAYISPQIFVKDSNGIKDIEVTNGGSNYSSEPSAIIVDVVSGQKLDTGILISVLTGTSISRISIEQNPKGLPDTEIKLMTLNNTNGFSIQRVSTYTSTIFDVYISQPTDGFLVAPFAPGDEIFIENIQSADGSSGSGFNSSDYGYNFLKVVDFNTTGLLARIRIDASEFTGEVGEPKTIQDFVPIITNKKVYPEFKITKERLTFAVGEKLYAGGSEVDLKIAASNSSYIKVFGSYELTEGEIITGRQSGTKCTISEIRENNARFDIDYSTKVITGWSNNIGKLNNDIQIIPDNDYYQNLSYTIKSPINYDDSKTVVNNFLHTIGTKNFSDTGITSESRFIMTSEDSTTVIKDFISDSRVDTINGFDMVRDIDSFGGYSNFLKFDSKLLTPYIKNSSNAVLKIDNINKQFSNLESNLNPYLDVINVTASNNEYLEVLVQVTNVEKTEIQLTEMVIVNKGEDSFLLEKGSIVSVGSSIIEYDGEKLGEFSLETRNTEHYLRFNPADFENTDYDLKIIQSAFKSNAIGMASTSIGFIKKINSIQRASGLSTNVGLTTNIVSLDSSQLNSIHVSLHLTDDITNDMQYSELYITHDGENTYMSELYFDDFGYDGNSYSSELIGSFAANLDSGILSLDFENTTSQNNITVKASIVGFGTTTAGISTYRFKKNSVPEGLERSAFYESYFESTSGSPVKILSQPSAFVNSAKSMVEVSIGSTKAIHQILTVSDGNSVYVKQLPFLSVTGISTADVGVGLGTFGGTISGGNLIVSFYPDQSLSGTFKVSTFNKVLYTVIDSINVAPDLNYYDNSILFGKDSVSVRYYNSFNGERINKTDFLMFSNELPIFSREIDINDPTHIDLATGTIKSEKHFFSENEELIYTPNSTISGIGSTALLYKSGDVIDQLPRTVYVVNKQEDSFQISTTSAGIAVTFLHQGEGNAHSFEMKKKNIKCVLTIDDVIQYPIFPKQIYYQLSESINAQQTIFPITGITTIVPKNILQIDDEYMNVFNVGFGTASSGPIVGFGTYNLVSVKRGFLGTASTSHSVGDTVSVNVGAFNIVGNTLHFTDPPKGNVQEDKDAGNLDSIKSDFTGRVFLRKDYTTNLVYDDISKEFNGVGRTFSLTIDGQNTVGLGTSGGNGLLLINGLFQTPSTSNNPLNNFSLEENAGITSVVFASIRQDEDIISDYDINQNDRPRGGLIVSLGSNLGIGYAPLVGARVKPIVSAAGTITDVVGVSYTGNPVSVSTASYNNFSGVIEITTEEPHMLSENDLVRLSGLGFTCPSNVGIVSYFPRSTNTDLENHFSIISVASSTTFTAQAGTSTLPHTYVGYGTVYPWYELNIGSGYRGPVSIGLTQEGHTGAAASITVNVGAGGTLGFTINDGGSGYSTVTKAIVSLPDSSYQQLEVEGVSRVGIGSTTETGVGLLVNVEVDSNPYYAGGRFLDAANLIDRNLQFIADVSVGRMLAYYPGFSVPGGNVNCVDDVKSVLETVVYNMRFGGNDRVYESAEVYLNNQALLAGEEEQSIYTFNVARDLAIDVMRNKPIVTRSITSGTFVDAANLISANKELIADVAVGRMLAQYPNFVIPGQEQIQPSNVTYDPVSGLSTITYANHGLFADDIIRIAPGSLTFTCSSDNYQTEVSYPRENDENIYGQDIRILSVTDNTFTINAGISTAVNHQPTDATYDPATGISTITIPNHGLITDTRVFMTAGGFTFTCGMDNHATQHTYPRQSDDNYNTTVGIASTTTNTITLQLAASGPNQYYTPTDVTYDPATGISTITIGEHNLTAGLPIIIQDNSLTFTCDMDGNQTQKSYPRPAADGKEADYASGRSISIASTTDTTITINVGASGENQLFTPTDATYDSTTGDLVLTIGAHTLDIGEGIVIVQDSIVFSCDQDNYSTLHAYPRATDPYGNNRSVNIIGITSTTITVNVGDAGSAVGAAHSFVSAAVNSIQHLPQSVHTFVGAATSAIQHLPQVGHTFVSALSNAIVSGGEYNHQFVGASSTAITININRECTDDIEDVLDTIAFNLTYGSNDAVYDAAKIYVDNAYLAGEEEQSIYAYEQARDLAIQAMRNEVITIDGYSTETQFIDSSILVDPNNPTCATVASAIGSFVGIVTQAIGLGTLPTRTVNTTLYTTETQIIDNTVIGDESQTPGVYNFESDCANVASAIGSYVGIVTTTIANVVAYGATATIPTTKTVAPASLFSIKNFTITRPGYSFKPGDVIRPVGLVTDYRLENPVSNFELTVLDTFTDSFALWQFGNLDYIDSIKAYQDGSRLAFPLYYNGQLLSFEKDKDSDFDIRNLLVIFINGILQEPGKSFDFNGGTTFVFTTAPKKEDNISIFFYRGTLGVDSALVSDIAQTIKIGDTVQVLKNDNYSGSVDQNIRLVQNVEFADRIETNLYSGPGIDAVNPRPISWLKQKRDKTIFGQTIYKTRESIQSQVYPTTKLISGLTTTSTEIFVESAKLFDYNNEILGKEFDLLVVNGISTTSINSVELLTAVDQVKGFAGVITGITSTNGIGTDKAIQFYVNNLDSDSFVTAGIETGYYVYIYDTRVGNGVTSIDDSNGVVGIGSSYLDSIYYVSGWSGVVGDDNVGIITCNVHPDTDLSGITSSGTEISPIGKFTWGRLSGFNRSDNPISIDLSEYVSDAGLTTYPTIQRRGIGLKLIYETGALPNRLV